jgi:hypothetical protein
VLEDRKKWAVETSGRGVESVLEDRKKWAM